MEPRHLSEAISLAERSGGYQAAVETFDKLALGLPPQVLWRALLDIGDCAKRAAAVSDALKHYAAALRLRPTFVQVWLETCRTLDELGELGIMRALLEEALRHFPLPSDQLGTKFVRVLERQGDLVAFRRMMGQVQATATDRMSKIICEALHVEVRAGRGEESRQVMQCLLSKMPKLGFLYCEATRLESILGDQQQALDVAKRGVQQCPKYGPIWFEFGRHSERVFGAAGMGDCAERAVVCVCAELHWKFHFEAAGSFARSGDMARSRQSTVEAVSCCPRHLRWRIWLLAARNEIFAGNAQTSRLLLQRAVADAPPRLRTSVWVEASRVEAYAGDVAAARAAIEEAHRCEGSEWKVFLEQICVEVREGCTAKAREVCLTALDAHPATGRLWCAFISLEHCGSEDVEPAFAAFQRAVREVPKSGEVWCEGARIHLNPFGSRFHIRHAKICLELAVYLTPQYGDSFLELLRVHLVEDLDARVRADPLIIGLLSGEDWKSKVDEARCVQLGLSVAQRVYQASLEDLIAGKMTFKIGGNVVQGGYGGEDRFSDITFVRADEGRPEGVSPPTPLDILCSYADPNYGFLWLWCRNSILNTAKEIIQEMTSLFTSELRAGALWHYTWAVTRAVLALSADACAPAAAVAEACGADGLDSRDFAMGSTRLARHLARGTVGLEQSELQKVIFGSDILSA